MTDALLRAPYRGEYRNQVDEPETPANQEENLEANPSDPSTTPSPDPVLSPEDKVYKQRYDSLKAHYDKSIPELRKENSQLREQLGKASLQNTSFPKTAQELAQWSSKYPDLYGMILTLVRQEFSDKEEAFNTRVQAVEQNSLDADRKIAEANLLKLHPDLHELIGDEDFHKWVDLQPATLREGVYENAKDYVLASRIIDLYKADKARRDNKPNKPQNQPNLKDAARSVTKAPVVSDSEGSQGKQWKLSDIAKLTPRQFEQMEAEIDKAREEGRVIDDTH